MPMLLSGADVKSPAGQPLVHDQDSGAMLVVCGLKHFDGQELSMQVCNTLISWMMTCAAFLLYKLWISSLFNLAANYGECQAVTSMTNPALLLHQHPF